METLMSWMGPLLDGTAIALLALVLWRLGTDPAAAWGEREQRLQAIFEELRALVAQSEGLARDLDGRLAAREERLQALVAAAEATARAPRGGRDVEARPAAARGARIEVRDDRAAAEYTEAAPAEAAADSATRIEALAAAGTGVEEIARRLGIAPAEVRLVIGLKAARAARRRAAEAAGAGSHAH